MATFERFFVEYMASVLTESVNTLITEESISIQIDDRIEKHRFAAEAMFLVVCNFSSKAKADSVLEDVHKAIRVLPYAKPLVMSASMVAQDVSIVGAPRKHRYTGAFQIAYHIEDSY